ncbi:MAG: DJ-1/PfpI family protein [Candidatus Methylomirabilales bacterium]
MAFQEKKVLIVIPNRDFQDEEYRIVRKALEGRGVKVEVATPDPGEARGMKGTMVRPTALLGDVKYYDYDAVIFVGGDGTRRLFDHEKATKLAKDAEYKVLGAIGEASLILANAGVLKGKRVTGSPWAAGPLRAKEAVYTGKELEVDGKVVTAREALYAEPFVNALLKALEK